MANIHDRPERAAADPNVAQHPNSPANSERVLGSELEPLTRLREAVGKVVKGVRPWFQTKELGVFLAILLLGVILSIVTPVFTTPRNLLNVGRQVSIIGIMAVGMTFVLVSGEVDLSVGAIYAIGPIVAGLLARNGVDIWLGCLVGLIVAGCIGCVNGYLSTKGRLPSFIATLGTMNVVRGLGLTITNAYPVVVSLGVISGPRADAFFFMGGGRLFGLIPMQFVWYLVISIIGGVLLGLTVFGRRIYAVGGNPRAAYLFGINVRLTKFLTFAMLGFLAGLAGLLTLSHLGTITATLGIGYELDVIAAVIIGGTPLGGGGGSIVGTFLGALLMGVLRNGLVLLGVSPFWQTTAIGVVIILAVGLDRWFVKGRADTEGGKGV